MQSEAGNSHLSVVSEIGPLQAPGCLLRQEGRTELARAGGWTWKVEGDGRLWQHSAVGNGPGGRGSAPRQTLAFVQTPVIFFLMKLIGLFLGDEPPSHLGTSTCAHVAQLREGHVAQTPGLGGQVWPLNAVPSGQIQLLGSLRACWGCKVGKEQALSSLRTEWS